MAGPGVEACGQENGMDQCLGKSVAVCKDRADLGEVKEILDALTEAFGVEAGGCPGPVAGGELDDEFAGLAGVTGKLSPVGSGLVDFDLEDVLLVEGDDEGLGVM